MNRITLQKLSCPFRISTLGAFPSSESLTSDRRGTSWTAIDLHFSDHDDLDQPLILGKAVVIEFRVISVRTKKRVLSTHWLWHNFKHGTTVLVVMYQLATLVHMSANMLPS